MEGFIKHFTLLIDMSIAAIILKVMPDSPEVDLESIKSALTVNLEAEGAQNISFEEEPVAFGLKAVMAKFAWPEEKETSLSEEAAQKIENVSSATITDYRRAFG
jgi:elongation factor 1-beta